MNKVTICIVLALCASLLLFPTLSYAENTESIIVATGNEVPIDNELPPEYRVPEKYTENAVQFVTEDGVMLCGYVLGEGSRGITLGHANGWMVKSWLPFGERLVDAGYMIILWEFRNIPPSGNAPESASQRWDLDVLAAVQVLRERGATEILAMGASDGGNATAVAAPSIPDLVGLGILSSPANSKGDAVAAVGEIDVPAFFAVSNNDPGGDFLSEVQKLYDACASEQKELHVLTSYEHGSDLLSDVDLSSRLVGSTEEQKQERRDLADNLMRFVNDAFGNSSDKSGESDVLQPTSEPGDIETVEPSHNDNNSPTTIPEGKDTPSDRDVGVSPISWVFIAAGVLLVNIIVAIVIRKKR